MHMSVVIRKKVVHYPETDGKPMAETDRHYRLVTNTRFSLEWHFRQRDDVYVSGNLFVYYEEGNPKKCVAPDVFRCFWRARSEGVVFTLFGRRGRVWM